MRGAAAAAGRAWALLLVSLLLVLLPPRVAGASGGGSVDDLNKAKVVFDNQGGVDVDVFWRHPQTKQYTLLATIAQGAGRDIATFRGHEFFVAVAGKGTPSAVVEPNYVQREAAENVGGVVVCQWRLLVGIHGPRLTYLCFCFFYPKQKQKKNMQKFVVRTSWEEGVGGENRVDVSIVPDLSGAGAGSQQQQQQQQQRSTTNNNDTGSRLSSQEPVQQEQEVKATVLLKNSAGGAVGIHWLDEGTGQYVKLVRGLSSLVVSMYVWNEEAGEG